MKTRKRNRGRYTLLRWKLFWRMMAAALLTALGTLGIYRLVRGNLKEPILNFMMNHFYLQSWDAATLYQLTINNNLELLISIFYAFACMAAFVAAFFMISSYVNSQMDKISLSFDALISSERPQFSLPPELQFIEEKARKCQEVIAAREQQAQIAEQKKNDLVVYLAHDIKTPLTSVIGYLNLLDEAPDMPLEQRAKYVNITLQKAYRLEDLINEFFEITRYNLQSVQLDKEPIDLYYLLLQMMEEFFPLLEPEGKKAILHADENLTLYGDPGKLARVFNNILKNAIAYSSPNSQIDIRAYAENDQVTIVFQNQGKTIPAQELNTIFEKFFRLDSARSTHTGGAGLGLAIAKEIITLHGGSISAESHGGITTFTVVLPDS